MSFQIIIDSIEREIELLEQDIFHVTNRVSDLALRNVIQSKKDKIEKIQKECLGELL